MRPRAASRFRNCSSGGGAAVLVHRLRLPVRDRRPQTRPRFRRPCHLGQLELRAASLDAQSLHAYPARRARLRRQRQHQNAGAQLALAGACTIPSSAGTISQAFTQIAPVAQGLFTINANGLAAANPLEVSASGTQTPENDYALQGGQIVADSISLRATGTYGVQVTIGGQQASVAYAGPQGAFLGLDQVNVVIPPSLAGKCDVIVQLSANGIPANQVYITIQ